MADKQNLACIAGTLLQIYKPKTGENSNGPWSIQNVNIKGTDGTEVTLWMKDRPEIPSNQKGRFIILTAKQGEKGLSGLYVMDDEYNGKTTRKIKVTPTAELAYQDGQPQQAPPQQQQQRPPSQGMQNAQQAAAESWGPEPDRPPQQQQSAPAQSGSHQRTQGQEDLLKESKRTIIQITNLHLLVAKAVDAVEAPRYKEATGMDMTEGQRQAAIASVFIESTKQGLVRNMPCRPLEAND
jgi:hypothetical protein